MNHGVPLSVAKQALRERIISTLETGDLVCTKAFVPMIRHYGIVCKESEILYVYHNDPDQSNHAGGNIIRENFADWIAEREIVNVTKTGIDITNIEQVVSKLKTRRYDLLHFNCEHFVTAVKNKRPASTQIIDFASVLATVFLVYLIVRKPKSRQ